MSRFSEHPKVDIYQVLTTYPSLTANKEHNSFTTLVEEQKTADVSKMEREIKEYTSNSKDISVYYKNLNAQQTLEIQSDRMYKGASTTKVLTAISAYKKEEEGNLKIDSLYYSGLRGEEVIRKMVNRSDNDTWDYLNFYLGFDYMTSVAKDLGMVNTQTLDNTTTAKDLGIMLEELYLGNALNAEDRSKLLGYMQNTIVSDRIPKGFPESINSYHKSGTYENNIHDIAIVETTQPYILVVLTNGLGWEEGTKTIQDISRIVYENTERINQ